jgi:hypothetical protein
MTPQEKDLITQLLDRLKQAGGQPKDPEAEALIRQAVAQQPDAPYYLVQTVLIQDMALNQAQSRIAELERQCAEAAQQKQPTSFLGGLFGSGKPATPGPSAMPSAGPWGPARPQPAPQAPPPGQGWGQPQPGYGAPPPGYAPGYGQPMMGMAQGGSGFLRSAAATAAGIAGGALLFQGIESMFGSHAGGILGGVPQQAGLSETVINNYYGNDSGTGQNAGLDSSGAPSSGSDLQYASDQDPSVPPDSDYASDPGTDFASDGSFGGDDSDLV